ncbi:hypothetical protein PIB30_000487 [Stylosanthes scabra]|uniref:TF-B3 domain-containing protein n=1 Tax=Stylosanthes scabra TaxID=79078 RepID=A0ABU6W0G7_9FABA|nr:hypothetical protein [Stylosanthes scabra]
MAAAAGMGDASAVSSFPLPFFVRVHTHLIQLFSNDDTAVVRIPTTFSNDVSMSRPARWNAITPRGNFLVRWGPDSQDRAQTIVTQGWDAICAANGITTGMVVQFELLGMYRRLLRVSVKEEKDDATSQVTQ